MKVPGKVMLSLMTEKLFCESFSEVHEAIEFLAGGPVWTHQIPSVMRDLEPALKTLYPEFNVDVSDVTPENIREKVAQEPLRGLCGRTVEIRPLLDPKKLPDGPLDRLAEHLRHSVIVVQVGQHQGEKP